MHKVQWRVGYTVTWNLSLKLVYYFSPLVGWTEEEIKRGSTAIKTIGNNLKLSFIVQMHYLWIACTRQCFSYCGFVFSAKITENWKTKIGKRSEGSTTDRGIKSFSNFQSQTTTVTETIRSILRIICIIHELSAHNSL